MISLNTVFCFYDWDFEGVLFGIIHKDIKRDICQFTDIDNSGFTIINSKMIWLLNYILVK